MCNKRQDVKRILEEKNDKFAPPMAPAKGLFLTDVKYKKNFAPRDPECALRSALQDGIEECDWKEAYGN